MKAPTVAKLITTAAIAATACTARAVPLPIVNPGFDATVTGSSFVYESFFYSAGDPMPDHTYTLENIAGDPNPNDAIPGDNITGLGDAASGATIANAGVSIFGYTGTSGNGLVRDSRDFLPGQGPDGSAAYIGFGDNNPRGIFQTLVGTPWQSNTTYTFRAEVSDRRFGPSDNVTFPSGGATAPRGIQLSLGGPTEPTGVLTFTQPPAGGTSLATYVLTTGAAGTHPTGDVTIIIRAQGFAGGAATQVVFDNLTLDASPAPPPPDADFDGDNDVDGADLLIWQRGVGVGTTQSAGDANFSGGVNGADLGIWKSEFGTPQSVQAAVAIPEPGGVALMALGALVIVIAGRRIPSRR